MPWYLLEHNSLSERERQRLVDSGIPFAEMDIERPRRVTGVAFQDNDRNRIFDLLGISTVQFEEHATERPGIVYLEVVGGATTTPRKRATPAKKATPKKATPKPPKEVSPEEKKARAEEEKKRKKEEYMATRRKYVAECNKRLAERLETARNDLEEAEATLAESQARISESLRIQKESLAEIDRLEGEKTEESKKFRDEFDALLNIDMVKRVEVSSGNVKVFTEHVYVNYSGSTYDIGEFVINIPTNGRGAVSCQNLTRKVNGYNHPHVQSSGNCCLGNISSGVAQLIGKYEFAMAAELMIRFLHSYNNSGPYHKIDNWKTVKRETK